MFSSTDLLGTGRFGTDRSSTRRPGTHRLSTDSATGWQTEDPTPPDAARETTEGAEPRVVVVTPQGMGIAEPGVDGEPGPADLVSQPAKVMRIGSMIKQLLEEVRSAPLDEAGRNRLAQIHDRSISELEDGLSEDLVAELRRIALPFAEGQTPSESELRIAQAQLVGWLEGLFHGIQTALVAQQMAAQAQLQEMRRALPGGQVPGRGPGGQSQPGAGGGLPHVQPPGTGQYL